MNKRSNENTPTNDSGEYIAKVWAFGQSIFYRPFIHTLLEIYLGGDKCPNFGHFAQKAPKYISAQNNLRPIFISAQ